MAIQQNKPLTNSTITEVPNADGTITRIIENEYKDGTRTTVKEILPEPNTAPQMVHVTALSMNSVSSSPSVAPLLVHAVANNNASSSSSSQADLECHPIYPNPKHPLPPKLPLFHPSPPRILTTSDSHQATSPPRTPGTFSSLFTLSIFFVVFGTSFGIAAGVYTDLSQRNGNNDRHEDKKAKVAGAAAIFLFSVATPFMFWSAKLYRLERHTKGLPSYAMASWAIYGFALAYGGGLLFLGIKVEDGVQPMWVYAAVVFNLVPFMIMLSHAEAARTK